LVRARDRARRAHRIDFGRSRNRHRFNCPRRLALPPSQRVPGKETAMWDLLFALAQVFSILFVVAGFVLATWYGWTRSLDDSSDD
jgi:hypothetical protein